MLHEMEARDEIHIVTKSIFYGLVFFIYATAHAANAPVCLSGDGVLKKDIATDTVVIARAPLSDKMTDVAGTSYGCRASIRDLRGKLMFHVTDFGMDLFAVGTLKESGEKYLIFQGDSGGAHCCWTYWFVALVEKPVEFAKLYNQRGIEFQKDTSGRVIFRTLDGAFDYFDGLCHACTAFPPVFLELKNKHLYDVSQQFIGEYDKEIGDARILLEQDQLDKFRRLSKYDGSVQTEYANTIAPVLRVIFGYLYSGRDVQAWQALEQMWPASDRERIKELILKTRKKGILSQLSHTKSQAGVVSSTATHLRAP